jgi:hypothetical protein
MKITKERVLSTINYIKQNPNFYFPFKIMCLDFDEHHEMYEEDCASMYSIFSKKPFDINSTVSNNKFCKFSTNMKLVIVASLISIQY